MAITYPRELPNLFLRPPRFSFDYTPLGKLSRTAGGAVAFQEAVGGSLWEMALTTKTLNETEYGQAAAWFRSLRGGAEMFKAYDVRRPWPLHYGPDVLTLQRAGGLGAFDGTVSVNAAGGSTVSLRELPGGYRVSEGDYLSFPWRGGRALVVALESAIAGGGGGINGLAVGPWLFASPSELPVTGTLVRAWCQMRPKPGSWSGERTTRDPVSFEAIQDLT